MRCLVRKYFMFLWIYKISFMSLAVAFPVYRLAQRLPQNFFHLRLLPAPSADRSFPFPLLPSDLTAPRTRSKFGASLSNYLYGIHNFCWWSFTQAASRWLTMAAWSAWTSVYGIEYLGCGIRVWVGFGWDGVGMLCGTVLQVALSLVHGWGHRWPAFRTLTRALKLSA